MKKEFTTERWEKALTDLFVKSICNPEYRELCLTNPRAAIAVVAPELELPEYFHFKFADYPSGMVYSYLLPPMLDDETSTEEYARKLIEHDVTGKTHPPTNAVCPDPFNPECNIVKGSGS